MDSFESIQRNLYTRTNMTHPAELFFDRMAKILQEYEKKADEKHQVLWRVIGGNGKEYIVLSVSYVNPSLMRFSCLDQDLSPCELLLNVAAVQFLISVVQLKPQEKKRRIGFHREEDSDGAQ